MCDQDVPGQSKDVECFMSSMASAGWCIEHLFQQNNDNFSRSSTNLFSRLHILMIGELWCSECLLRSLFQ